MRGGFLGIDPTETAAKIFVWDIEEEEKLTEFVPKIPDAAVQPKMISGMSLGPDELLWSAADGTIFAMDPDTLEIVKSKNIYPDVTDYGRWRPIHIRWGVDGLMYTTLAGKLTVVNPSTLELETLAETELMTIGDDGNIYYADGSDVMMKIEVMEKVTLEIILDLIEQQSKDGNIQHSLSKKLVHSVKQAIHHRDMDRLQQADKFVQKALRHLEEAHQSEITADAKMEIRGLLENLK
ncbi:FIMAH domain-containing protein [Oceanobacillus chungangensis]|uniref:FIMAH domain-containing protein n=1 Tax=Oceanobacillus chungangensis TaxID=1229152 RepID=A0A3D8PZ93_9BACI|nr:hypothetical protein [Oceanobacillus chungangensis]RDW20648.1 hypothetical protein CWR45_05295 [Oceanobacillus chungangensis]